MVYAFSPSMWKAEAWSCHYFKVSLGYLARPCLKKQNKTPTKLLLCCLMKSTQFTYKYITTGALEYMKIH